MSKIIICLVLLSFSLAISAQQLVWEEEFLWGEEEHLWEEEYLWGEEELGGGLFCGLNCTPEELQAANDCFIAEGRVCETFFCENGICSTKTCPDGTIDTCFTSAEDAANFA